MRQWMIAVVCAACVFAAPASAQKVTKDSDPAGAATYSLSSAPPDGGVRTSLLSWDKVSGNWKVFRGKLRQQWGKLTSNDLQVAAGKREILVGRIQARYGIDKAKADQQVDLWLKQQEQLQQ